MVAGFFGYQAGFQRLQLLPIYQAKESAAGSGIVWAACGRAASAAPCASVGVAGLAAWGSAPRPLALARQLRCPLRGLRFGWVCGVPRPSSLRAFSVVRLACAGRCLGAGGWRSVVAPGGRRGLSPVLAVCLWGSVVAPCPRLRAVAARCGGLPVRPWVPGCLFWLLPRSISRGCPSWVAAPVALWTRWTGRRPPT